MPTPYDFSSSLLIDDFDTFVRYLNSKSRLPLTGAGDLKSADLCRTAVAGDERTG